MALEQPFGVQALSYSGEQERRGTFGFLLARGATIGSVAGGVVNLAAGDFIATAPVSGMSVNNAVGEAVVPGSTSTTQSGYPTRGSSITNSVIAAADPSNPRIDGVYLQINDANYAGLTNSAVITVVTGTPTSGATLANLSGAGAAPVSSELINYVLVPAAATSIIAADLGDKRVQVKASSAIASGNVITGVSTNTAMVSGTSYIVSSLSPTMTLPVPAIGAWVVVSNYGSGTAVISHNASEVIYGPGQGASGASTMNVLPYGQSRTLESDGTSWYETSAGSGAAATLSGHLSAANVTLVANTATEVLDTASLAPGTWDISFISTIEIVTDSLGHPTAFAAVKSGTATLEGTVMGGGLITSAAGATSIPLRFTAVVTAAAVIKLSCAIDNENGGLALGSGTYGNIAMTNLTGYVAVQTA